MYHSFRLSDLTHPGYWIGIGIYFVIAGKFLNYYRWGSRPYSRYHQMTPELRPAFFILGVFSLAFGVFMRVVQTSYPVHATYSEAMVGAGLVAFALGYVDLRFLNRGLGVEAAPQDVPVQPHAHIQEAPQPDAFYVDPKAARGPKTVKSAMMLGDFYCREGKFDEAIEAYEDGLRSDPSNAELRARIEQAKKR